MAKRRLPVIGPNGCPRPDLRAHCWRISCRHHIAASTTAAGTLIINGIRATAILPVARTSERNVRTSDIERAARLLERRIRRGDVLCALIHVAAHPGGMSEAQVARVMKSMTRQRVQQVEAEALAKVGGGLLGLDENIALGEAPPQWRREAA